MFRKIIRPAEYRLHDFVALFENSEETARAFMTLDELQAKLLAFRDARDWKQFHAPNQLAAALAIEAGELQEHFLWKSPAEVRALVANPEKRDAAAEELADVLNYCLLLAEALGVKPAEIILKKIAKNEDKYPVEKARGRATKYTDL